MTMKFDARRLLELPIVYNAFQKLTRTREYRRRFMERVPISPGARVLEVGCGPGTNFEFLQHRQNVHYVGCDIDPEYIAHANRKYGPEAKFFAIPVGKLGDLSVERFDTALAWGLLHHLKDSEVLSLCDEVYELLHPGGVFCTFDPCFTYEQPLFERVLTACDRGRFVRYPEQYATLLQKRFPQASVDVWPPGTILRYSVTVLVASKDVRDDDSVETSAL